MSTEVKSTKEKSEKSTVVKKKTTTTKPAGADKPKVAKLVKPDPAKKIAEAQKKIEAGVSAEIDKLAKHLDAEGEMPADGDAYLEGISARRLGDGEVTTPLVKEDSISVEVMEVPNESKNLLIAAKPWCFKCSHFVSTDATRSEELKAYQNCHYSAGNNQCPAKYNRFILGVPIEETAELLATATLKNDLDEQQKQLKNLSKYDPIMQRKVMERYRQLLVGQQNA